MRQPRPYFRNQTQCWYVQLGKKQINLGPDEKAAWEKYHALMLNRQEVTTVASTVVILLDEYLEWVNKKLKPGTYEKSKHYLTLFAKHIGAKLRIDQLNARVVTEWTDEHPDWTMSLR